MTARQIYAVFDSRDAAARAREDLLGLGLQPERISITDQASSVEGDDHRGGLWAHMKEILMPNRDRATIDESLRRGGTVLVANVDDTRADEACARLDRAGAVDLDAREAEWRASGWNDDGHTERSEAAIQGRSQPRPQPGDGPTGAAERESIPVVEERLRVGKREVNRGGVRVRSRIVEEPVHEEVHLREERVNVERRPVDEPTRPVVKGSPQDLMQERTVEVTETAEQAVVGKEARVTEEVVVTKEPGERVERIDDTVRRTEVEVERGGKPPMSTKRGTADPDKLRRT